MKNNHPTYTIEVLPVGDHLKVTIPDLGLVVETQPGKIKRDDAVALALAVIREWQKKQGKAHILHITTSDLRLH